MTPDGLLEAFWEYERALRDNDLETMSRLFAPEPTTLRGDSAGLLIGHDNISSFRGVRGGAPPRTIADLQVQTIDETAALVVAITAPLSGGHGLQTQLWRRIDGRWLITAAHVSAPPMTYDRRVWRVVGDPLVTGSATGPLTGESVAVKDLFAVAGHPVGAGVPKYLAGALPAARHASAVQRMLDGGASVRGIAQTDQLAYSLVGDNPHYGAPVNAVLAGGLPGGSSSGCATAVALGAASIGLATDTAGSIRVPASYQGLWGIRTTHGAVPVDGLLPLAPDFDSIGLLTRDPHLLQRATEVLLGQQGSAGGAGELVKLAELGIEQEIADWAEAFRAHQGFQAWEQHGSWLSRHPGAVTGAVAERFAVAASISSAEDERAREVLARARARLDALLGTSILELPAAASPAPRVWTDHSALEATRAATLRLTCLSGITGRPSVVAPGSHSAQGPVGTCYVGPRGSDLDLIALAASSSRDQD